MSWTLSKFRNTQPDNNNNFVGSNNALVSLRRLEDIVNNLDKKLKNNFDMTFAAFKTEEILNEIKRLDLSKAGSISSILMERLTTLTSLLQQIKNANNHKSDNL